ncbi:MAG: ABC transporter ATP-binding protein [Anaerolineaceae bacterium]|nr:ABC transporter ATP-binding protein [Anaerolineaceae bacterium]
MPILDTRDVTKQFGGLIAVNQVSMTVNKNEIVGIIGPNGAGKTSFINALTGIYKPSSGQVFFQGRDITGLPAYKISKQGIARTFQNLRVFSNISVLENVLIGAHCKIDNPFHHIFLHPLRSRKVEHQAYEKVITLLKNVGLEEKKESLAKNLSYGEQRILEICRALASDPELLILDEPCAGMNSAEMDTLADFVKKLRDEGQTIVVIEHNMRFMMAVSDRIIVMTEGAKFREGTPAEIRNDLEVQKVYLGEQEAE